MRAGHDLAERLQVNGLERIAAGEGRAIPTGRANDRALQVTADISKPWHGVCGLLGLQRPLLSSAVDLTQVIDTGVHLRGRARPNEVGNRDSCQQPDDGDHDHDFHERETRLFVAFDVHTTLCCLSFYGVNKAAGGLHDYDCPLIACRNRTEF